MATSRSCAPACAPGEKLYEELLIDAESEATAHPLIYRARERAIPPAELWPQLDVLQAAIARQDVEIALALLERLVPEWQRGGDASNPKAPDCVQPVQNADR